MTKKPFPSLPAASVSLNAMHDALKAGASHEDAMRAGTTKKDARPAPSPLTAPEARTKPTDKKPTAAE